MAGRPRIPEAEKRLKGTYRKCREDEYKKKDEQLNAVLPESRLKVPKSITDPVVRKIYKEHIALLHGIGTHAEQQADSPLLEMAYTCLQQARKIFFKMSNYEPLSDERERLEKLYMDFMKHYERIVKDFYLTPTARAKLKLVILTATEKEVSIEKEKNIIASLIAKKES